VRVADDLSDTWDRGNFFRRALGVASGNYDLSVRIFPMDAADGCAGIVIGSVSDGARIEHNEFSFCRSTGASQSTLFELALDRRAVGLGGSASEVLDVESCHESSVT
jgi:hypothetical protein